MRRLAAIAVATFGLAAIGCVPPPPQTPVISSFTVAGAPHVAPAVVPATWHVTDPQGDTLTCRLDGDGNGTWDITVTPCTGASRNTAPVAAGAHTARLEVSDGTNTTTATTSYTVAPSPTTEPFNIEIRPSGPIPDDLLAAYDWAARRWEQIIIAGVPDEALSIPAGHCATHTAAYDGVVDDLVVDVSMGTGLPSSAWASPCRISETDTLPRYGWVQFDTDGLDILRSTGALEEVAAHELGHVLGWGVIWTMNRDLVTGPIDGLYRFTGPRAVAEYSALGGPIDTGGPPLDTVNDTLFPHWYAPIFGFEILTATTDGTPVSSVSIAAMADLGYTVDLAAADPFSFPEIPGPR